MIRTLILKELHQHFLAFLLIAAGAAFGLFILVGITLMTESGSLFEVLRLFLVSLAPIIAMVLGNRLVVCEYQARTQLFLEALPLARMHMVLVKYGFGLCFLSTLVAAVLVLVIPLSIRSEQLTYRFLMIVAARSVLYVWCMYSFFFALGLMGRYRIAIYLVLGIGLIQLVNFTSFELSRFGPFALMNSQFSFERVAFPLRPLAITAGLAAGFSLLALVLSLIHEGSVATMLAEKMSHREKVFVACIVIGILFAAMLHGERTQKKPFDLPGAWAEQSGEVTVKVSHGASSESSGRELARFVAAELSAVQDYLQTAELPPTFIVQRRDLDPDRYELGVLDGAEGLLVRANFQSPRFDKQHFLAWLIRESLVLKTNARVSSEPTRWVLDGFGDFWAHRQIVAQPLAAGQPRLALRAAYASSLGFSASDLGQWLSYRERVGPEIATAVAWSGLVTLAHATGDEPCRQFVRSVIGPNSPADARATLYAWRNPWPLVLERETDLAPDPFVQLWLGELGECAKTLAGDLATVPRPSGTIEFAALSFGTRKVAYEFHCDPAPASGRFVLQYSILPPFNQEVPEHELKREDRDYVRQSRGELPTTYSRGTRLYSTFAVRDERLGCEIITGWTRREIE